MEDIEGYKEYNAVAISSLDKDLREQQWTQCADRLRLITDALGKPIDTGIFDTVVALNIFDIHTTQSCEGHAEHGTLAPWVEIQAPETDETKKLRKRVARTMQTIEALEKQGKSDEELNGLYQTFHRLNEELRRPQLEEIQKVMILLEKFYKDRQVDYSQLLIIHGNRLESQGAQLQSIIPSDERGQKLDLYQKEMKSFTEFLKGMHLIGS